MPITNLIKASRNRIYDFRHSLKKIKKKESWRIFSAYQSRGSEFELWIMNHCTCYPGKRRQPKRRLSSGCGQLKSGKRSLVGIPHSPCRRCFRKRHPPQSIPVIGDTKVTTSVRFRAYRSFILSMANSETFEAKKSICLHLDFPSWHVDTRFNR